MEYRKIDDRWIIVLRRGEGIIEKLAEFLANESIRSGCITGIGAVSRVELGHFSLETKKYSTRVLERPLELVSLTGNVAMKGEERIIHCHAALGDEEMRLCGGHLVEGVVSATCELVLTEYTSEVAKSADPDTGLNLMHL